MTTQPAEPSAAISALALGAHINAWRYKTLKTQADLGEAIGVSQSTMAKKLRGLVPITAIELYGLAEALEVDVADLLPPAHFLVRGARRLEAVQAPDTEVSGPDAVRQQGLEPRTRCYGVKRPDLRVYDGGQAVRDTLTPELTSVPAPTRLLRSVS